MDELTQNSKRLRQISRMITNGEDYGCFAEEVVDCVVEHGKGGVMVGVEEVQEVADQVGGGGVDILVHAAGFLEGGQCLGCEDGAVSVGAVWIVEAVGGFLAVGSA